MNVQQRFDKVFHFVLDKGELVSQAKSCWGADRWELRLDGFPVLAATLEDDGYTRGVFWGSLKVRQTCGYDLVFSDGCDEKTLEISSDILV